MNDGPHPSRGQERPDIAMQRLGHRGLLRHGASPQGRTGERESLTHDREQVDLRPRAADQGNDYEPSLDRRGLEIAREITAADQIENHIHAAARGFLADHLDEILGAVVDSTGGSEALAGARLLFGAGSCEDARPPGGRELDGRGADSAGPAVNQNGLTRFAPAAIEQIGPYREKRL